MQVQTFFKIISKHFEKENISNFHGIIITPYYSKTDERVKFGFKNPNDLSFNYDCLIEHFWQKCEFMARLLGILYKENDSKLLDYIKIDHPKGNTTYLNKSDKKKINGLFKSIKHFEFESGDITIEADLEFVKGDIYSNNEMVDISAKYIFKNVRNKTRQFDYDTNLEYLRNWVYDDYRNYESITFDTLQPVISFITSNPLLFYRLFMYVNANINPVAYRSDGTVLAI